MARPRKHRVPNEIKPSRYTSRQKKIKMAKIKERFLEAKGEKQSYIQGKPPKTTS